MSNRAAASCRCPHCAKVTQNAFIPLPINHKAEAEVGIVDSLVVGFKQKLVCLECTATWEAVALPTTQMKQLLQAAQTLEEAKREIAMLKLLVAKDRRQNISDEPATTLKIHRAA